METIYLNNCYRIIKGKLFFRGLNHELKEKLINFSGRIDNKIIQFTLKNSLLHSYDDNPAVLNKNTAKWYLNGKLHRDNDKPAIISKNLVVWYYNNKIHRDNDKPAKFDTQYNTKYWYKNGKKHRENKPAVLYNNNDYEYRINGKLHRDEIIDDEQQPAIFYKNVIRNTILKHYLYRSNLKEMPKYYKQWNINGKLKRIDKNDLLVDYDKLYKVKIKDNIIFKIILFLK